MLQSLTTRLWLFYKINTVKGYYLRSYYHVDIFLHYDPDKTPGPFMIEKLNGKVVFLSVYFL